MFGSNLGVTFIQVKSSQSVIGLISNFLTMALMRVSGLIEPLIIEMIPWNACSYVSGVLIVMLIETWKPK